MGSSLGPLMANTVMSSIEAQLKADGNIPDFYKRFVNDTFTIVPGTAAAETLHQALNAHLSVPFSMEIEVEGNTIHTEVYRKSTNTGLFQATRTSDIRKAC